MTCYYLNVHFQGQRVKVMKFYSSSFYLSFIIVLLLRAGVAHLV